MPVETEEEKKKKRLTPAQQAAALEAAPKAAPTPAPTPETPRGPSAAEVEARRAAGVGHMTEGAKRVKKEAAVESALTREKLQSVGGPEDPAVVGLRHAKGKGYQPGLGGAGAFNAAFKTIYAGGQAGLTVEQAADLALKKLKGGK